MIEKFMRRRRQYSGFSLTEVLLAVGTLAVGMIFISGTFLTGIHFSTIATERTIAAVVADEAFAKVKIYGSADPDWLSGKSTFACFDFSDVEVEVLINSSGGKTTVPIVRNPNEFAYGDEKKYYWSALCRPVYSDLNKEYSDPNDRVAQVTVFISRKVGSSTMYWTRDPRWKRDLNNVPSLIQDSAPRLVPVNVVHDILVHNGNELSIKDMLPIEDLIDETTFVNDGFNILDNQRGQIYRVIERYADNPSTIVLDRPWQGGSDDLIWVIPPPIDGGRNPCIGIYQKLIRFEQQN